MNPRADRESWRARCSLCGFVSIQRPTADTAERELISHSAVSHANITFCGGVLEVNAWRTHRELPWDPRPKEPFKEENP